MILQRLASAIRHHNWSQIFTEILIVVIGIFLGLQVQGWNEARQDDLRSVEVLEDLRIEFVGIEQRSARTMVNYAEIVSDLGVLVKSMNAGALLPENEEAVNRTQTFGDIFYDPPPLSSTFRDLVGSGRLALIRSKELRLALTDYDQSHGIIKDSDLNITTILGYYGDAFKRHSRLDPNYVIPDSSITDFADIPLPGVSSINFDAMQSDPEFRVAAEQLMRMQIIRHGNNKVAHDSILRVQALLASDTEANQ